MRSGTAFGRVLPALVGLGMFALACGSSEPELEISNPERTSPSPAQLWSASGITDYTMTYTSTCGDGPWIALEPVTVRVSGGDVERVSGAEPGKLATMANLYGLIDAAYASSAYRVESSSGTDGQLSLVKIQYSDALDNQLCFDITSFEPAP